MPFVCTHIGLTSVGTGGFYTIGNDKTREMEFSWTESGTPVRVAFTNWHQGQPNDVGGRQDCLLMQYQDANYELGMLIVIQVTHLFVKVCKRVIIISS